MVTPFPFERLEQVPAAALGPLRAAARISRASSGWASALQVLRALLGTDVHLGVVGMRWVEPNTPPELPDALVALRVELPSGLAIVELAPSGALAIVGHVLGTAGDDRAAFRPLRDAERGILAYVAARFLMAAQPTGSRLLGWTTDPRALLAGLRRDAHVAIDLDLTIGGQVHAARLWLAGRSAVLSAAPIELAPFADLPVRVGFDLGGVELVASEIVALRAGDVVLLDVAHVIPGPAGPTGRLTLRVLGARGPAFWCTLAEPRVVRIDSRLPDKETVPMGHKETQPSPPSLGPLAAELPVEVVVELARATMTVGAVSSFAPGEIVVLDRAPMDPVTLTVGDRVLGHGELVVVEGQVGVRILDVARR